MRWNCDWSSDVCSSDLPYLERGQCFGGGDTNQREPMHDQYRGMSPMMRTDCRELTGADLQKCEAIRKSSGMMGAEGSMGPGGNYPGMGQDCLKLTGEKKTECENMRNTMGKTPWQSGNSGMGPGGYSPGGNYPMMGPGGSQGGMMGPGMMQGGESGCFYTNVKKNNQSIGFSVHCTSAGTDCREQKASGPVLDMTGVALGTEKNCYG